MEQSPDNNSALQDLIAAFKKHRRGMLAVFAATVLLVAAWTFLQTPVYKITSRIMVKYGREYVYRPVDLLQKGDVQPMFTFNREEIINTEIQIFKSSELAAEVIRSIGLKKIYPKIADSEDDPETAIALAVNRFNKDLDVNHIKGSAVIEVVFQHNDPDVGVEAVRTLEKFFRERHLEVFKSPRVTFLEKQLALYRDKLINAKREVENFKQKNHIIALDEQKRLLLQEHSQIHSLLVQARSRQLLLTEKIAALQKQLESIPVNIPLFNDKGRTNNIDQAKTQLLMLKLEEQDLLQKYKEDNRLVKNVREKIQTVNNFLARQGPSKNENQRNGRNYVYDQIEKQLLEARADLKGQVAENNALEAQLKKIEEQLKGFSKQEAALNILKEAVDINEKTYKNFANKLEEMRILDAMDDQKMVNVAIIEKPLKPVKPASPRKGLNMLVGIILGLAFSFAYALFHDYFVINETNNA